MTAANQLTRAEATVPRDRVALACLAIMSLAAAVIHFAVAGAHFAQYWLYGVILLAAAWFQLLWGLAAITRPARWLLWSGLAVNAAVADVYIMTRTVGALVGPAAHSAEAVRFSDGLCTALEVIVAIGCGWLLASVPKRSAPRRLLIAAPAATGAVTATLLSVALLAGGPEMAMTAAASARPHGHGSGGHKMSGMHMTRAQTPLIRLATSSPAGAVTMPSPMMQMAPGMRMASAAPCTARPTAAQRAAAVRLVNVTWKHSLRFRSLAAAQAAGYRPITPSGLPVVHYLNVRYYLSMLSSGKVLNPAEPQSLVYANTPAGAVLVAAMYITTPGGLTPQPGGCLTQWHVHTNLCLTRLGAVVGVVTALTPTCPLGSVNKVTPPMMHVWFVPIPGGPTAIDASDAQIVKAAERVHSPRNGVA